MRTDESHPPLTFYPPFFYCWTTAQFKGRGLHLFFKERAPGDKIYLSGEEVFGSAEGLGQEPARRPDARGAVARRSARPVDGVGDFHLTFADGRERDVQMRVLPTKYFLKGGLYGGLDGWFHGDDRGKLHPPTKCGTSPIRQRASSCARSPTR